MEEDGAVVHAVGVARARGECGDGAVVGTGDRAGRRIRRARRSARCEAAGRARAGATAADAVAASDIVGLLAGVKSGGVPAGCDRRQGRVLRFRRRDEVAVCSTGNTLF